MTTKTVSDVRIKDETKGEIVAVFATLEPAIDHDGDVTRKGAFGEQDVVISAYGHQSWLGAIPVGLGKIKEVGDEAIMEGRFFLDTEAGRDTFTTVKQLGEAGLQEFSYGFDVIKQSFGEQDERKVQFLEELRVHEVSPVLKGAGINTRVLSAKGARLGDHIDLVVAEVEGLISRAADVVALRAAKSKGLSEASAEKLAALRKGLADLDSLLTTTPPVGDLEAAQQAIRREYARFVRTTTGD